MTDRHILPPAHTSPTPTLASLAATAAIIALLALAAFALTATGVGATGIGPATAEANAGTTTIQATKSARKRLRRHNVKMKRIGGAKVAGRNWRLTVAGGQIRPTAATSVSNHRAGGIRLQGKVKIRKKGRTKRVNRKLTVRNFIVITSGSSSRVTARVGGTQMTIFRMRNVPALPFNPLTGEVLVSNARLQVAPDFRRAYQRKFKKAPPKNWGGLRLTATLSQPDPTRVDPPVAERPEDAVDITAAEMTWRPRESWACYLNEGTATNGSGATGLVTTELVAYPNLSPPADPNQNGCPGKTLNFTFDFAGGMFEDGWYDPETGRSWIKLSDEGTVFFKKPYAPYFIDLNLRDGEILLDGNEDGSSTLIFATDGPDHRPEPWTGERAIHGDLHPTLGPPPELEANTDTGQTVVSFERIPSTNPSGPTAWEGKSFYEPGAYNGWIGLAFTVDAVVGDD